MTKTAKTIKNIPAKNNLTGTINNSENLSATKIDHSNTNNVNNTSTYQSTNQQLQTEEELMRGTGEEGSSKNDVMDKNLHQMFDVLRLRLTTLHNAARMRLELCEQDVNKNSDKTSDQAPKILDEFDEVIPRSLRDIKMPTLSHKDNLISSDIYYIDPSHLVFSKTKVPTEAAKKIEIALEENFGNGNLREIKNKKKPKHQDPKKSEQLIKNETNRMNRLKIERKLQQNMESFVTRSVMDSDLRFNTPSYIQSECDWPVSVKWSKIDQRTSYVNENMEGEFDPDLLLRYAVERITLPSGKKLFSYLVRQPMIQRYFVALFWLIKVKFFENDELDSLEIKETYLMRYLAKEYRVIIEKLAARAHAEHEKDFVFKFLPYILTNAIYYGFYYIFPGSRHIYTKALKKTIYMQVIQVMHGIQVCPLAVKTAWVKLFPDDAHEEGEEDDLGGESFPVLIAIKGPANKLKNTLTLDLEGDSSIMGSDSIPLQTTTTLKHNPILTSSATTTTLQIQDDNNNTDQLDKKVENNTETQFHLSTNPAKSGRIKGGFLSDMKPKFNDTNNTSQNEHTTVPQSTRRSSVAQVISHRVSLAPLPNSSQSKRNTFTVPQNNLEASAIGIDKDMNTTIHSNEQHILSHHNSYESRSQSADNSSKLHTMTPHSNTMILKQSLPLHSNTLPAAAAWEKTILDYTAIPDIQTSLSRTYLLPPKPKPGGPRDKRQVIRQNVHEGLNAHEHSPQIQLYLAEAGIAKPPSQYIQALQRTIPISWCAAGGSDTHHKRIVQTELHNDISSKLKKSQKLFKHYKLDYHKEKIKTIKDNEKGLEKLLTSGQTNISKFSLDLIRRQKAKLGNNLTGKEFQSDITNVNNMNGENNDNIQQLLYYSDEELKKILDEI